MGEYRNALTAAMSGLGKRNDAIFLGQAVAYPGTGMTETLVGVPREKLIEFPVMENSQMGMSTGLALAGYLPISIYPRWNFLGVAFDQLVNHLDKLPDMGAGSPRVIIRTSVPWPHPMDPGPQHKDDFAAAFRALLRNVLVVELLTPEGVRYAYHDAAKRAGSTILVEHARLY